MHNRLGLKLHRDAWPTARVLATHEEAGARWLEVEPGPGAPGTAAAVPRPAGRARPGAPAGLAGALRDHGAPLLLELEPSQRPALAELMAGPLRALAAPPSERVAA
jgi:hypothetical protein